MRTQLALALGSLLCGTLVACGGEDTGNDTTSDPALGAPGGTTMLGGTPGAPSGVSPAASGAPVATPPAGSAMPAAPVGTPPAAPGAGTAGAQPALPADMTPVPAATPPAAPAVPEMPAAETPDPALQPPAVDVPPEAPVDDVTMADPAEMPVDEPAAPVDPVEETPVEPVDEGPMTGEELFAATCSVCHGADALGGDLGPGVRYSDSGLTHFLVREGRESMTYPGPMVPLGEDVLSEAEIDLVVEYLWSFTKPTTGQELFVQICANCHGADGAGGPTGRRVIGESQRAQQLVRNGHNGAYDDRREFMPSYDQSQISDQELQMIIQFIDTL